MKTIKKVLVIATLAMFSFVNVFGQDETPWNDKKHQLQVSYGIGTINDLACSWGLIFFSGLSKDDKYDFTTTGSITVGYQYNVKPRVSVGLDLNYEGIKMSDYKYDNFVFLATTRIYYHKGYKFATYCKLGAGAMITNNDYGKNHKPSPDDENISTRFAFQVTPFGIEVGSQKARFFAETGIGDLCGTMAGLRLAF